MAETGGPFRLAPARITAGIDVNRCQRESGPGVTRINLFGKKLESRVAPSYYLESLLCNAPTEAFSNKRSRARRRMYVRWCIPRGLFGKGCSRSGLPPAAF